MIKMRMFFVVFVLFIVAATLASAAVNTVYYGKSPRIDVDLASQDPDPVEPGKIVEVSFKLDNKGELANDVVFEIIPEYPFSILPGESAVKNIGTLGTAQDTVRSVFVKYKLKVDQNAVDGNQELKIRYKSSDSESWITIDNTTIKVQSKEAILSVEKFAAVPESVAPGSKTRLAVSLRNHANSLLKDIKVTLDLGKSSDEETPFAPVGSTNEKVIPFIDAQATSALEFNLIADPDAKSKVYKVPLKLQYSDILNKNYSKTLTLALVVGVEPDISVYVDTTSVYTAGSTGDISVKIVNKGLSDLKFLNVKLDKSEKYKVLSPYEVYIGNIDSDDYETADFDIALQSYDKIVEFPIKLTYRDVTNKEFSEEVVLKLKTQSKGLILTIISGIFSVLVTATAAILAVLGAYWLYSRRKKRREG